ncbi:hypothetical protein [Aureibacter tunicatorum]|uniref:Uncharacterized protein n=1 Tax=Aureibacter tunicatorum TaxID=866807 RepID=A0AAE4BQX1_9BACT|nr:hypothetical protein [Aureibacter tunicatorum]MDR6237175.1 hypothetical protein [Aureibacter tunicatorum]BDD06167.1 hypothetical protein AUTU_36500 [Aureibacter tunicatorum]
MLKGESLPYKSHACRTKSSVPNAQVSVKLPPESPFLVPPVIQAAFKPGKIKHKCLGKSFSRVHGFSPLPNVKLLPDQMVIVEDQNIVAGGAGLLSYEVMKDGVAEPFWVSNADMEIVEEPDHSFIRLMKMFDECWSGQVLNTQGYYDYYGDLAKNLYSFYTLVIKKKPSCTKEEQEVIARDLVGMAMRRPEDRNLRLKIEGKKDCYYKHAQLKDIKSFGHFPDYFINMYGRLDKEVKPEQKGASPVVDDQSVPYKFDFYLNVNAANLTEVARDLIPMLDDPSVLGGLYVKNMAVAPLRNLASRTDTINLKVTSPEGFEKVREYLIQYVDGHVDFFVDDCLELTERIAPGLSWSQDSFFDNVWDMDGNMLGDVGVYLDRVAMSISDHKQNKSFLDLWWWKWSEMESLHHEVQVQLVRNAGADRQLDYDKLRRLSVLTEELSQFCPPHQVIEWIDHYDKMKKKFGTNRYSFLGIRTIALAELMKKKPRDRMKAFKSFMRILRDHGIDLFHPHLNRPIKQYREEGMVVIDQLPEESSITPEVGLSAPEACYIPSVRSEDGESVLEKSTKFFTQETVDPSRQILKVNRKRGERWQEEAKERKLMSKIIEEERDEL